MPTSIGARLIKKRLKSYLPAGKSLKDLTPTERRLFFQTIGAEGGKLTPASKRGYSQPGAGTRAANKRWHPDRTDEAPSDE